MSAETTGTPTAREVDPTTRWLGRELLVLVAAVLAVQLVFPYRQDWPAHLLGGGGILWVIAGLSPRWLRRVSALLGFGVVAAVGWVTEHLVFGPPDVVDVCFTLAGAVVAFQTADAIAGSSWAVRGRAVAWGIGIMVVAVGYRYSGASGVA